jgi:cell division protein ZapA (FtsZ GTPase activity inhibitor)
MVIIFPESGIEGVKEDTFIASRAQLRAHEHSTISCLTRSSNVIRINRHAILTPVTVCLFLLKLSLKNKNKEMRDDTCKDHAVPCQGP